MAGISKKRIKTKTGEKVKYTITYTDIFGKRHTSGYYETIKEAKRDLWKFDEDECCLFIPDNYIGKSFSQYNFKLRDGYNGRPFAIRVWLIIIQDNILHLIINYLSIKYF